MYISNQIKLFIAVFFITSFTANSCMLSEFKHKPITQQPDSLAAHHRDYISKWIKFAERGELNPIKDVTIVRDATEEEQQGRCFNYAIAQITGNTTPLKLYKKKNGRQKSTINVEKYFKQTVKPKNNDLALYTDNEDSYIINHFTRIVDIDNTIFESQFGRLKKITQHQPFAVPLSYGNAISYWTLKNKYQNDKERLRKTIRDDAEAFNNGQKSYKKQKINHYL